MSTLGDLLARWRTVLRDDGPNAYIDDDDGTTWLNEAQDDLALRLELVEHEVTGTFASDSLTLPVTDPILLEVTEVIIGTDDHVRFTDIDEYSRVVEGLQTATSTVAVIFDGAIQLSPDPTGQTYVLRYKALPTPMADTDDTWQLPRWTERKALAYARYQAKMKDEQPGAADRYLAEYEQDLPSVPSGREHKFPGPIRARIQGNVFDADPQARHLMRN